jgi:sugar phosphate isomerase/epimerase
VFLGLENHGGIVAEAADLLDLVRAVKSPWVGINLDTGNFRTADPYADLARCAPYAVNVQIKAELQPRGKPQGPADLARLVRILREAGYQGYVALEYEAAADPWTAVPPLLGRLRELLG